MNTDLSAISENRLRRQARQYMGAYQLDAAQTSLEALIQRIPEDVSAHIDLATVMMAKGRMRAAARQFLQASQSLPDDAALISQLVRHLYLCGEVVAARKCLDHPAMVDDTSPQRLVMQANHRRMLGEIGPAMSLMDRAMNAGIDTPAEHQMHAMLLQFTGDIERAGEVLAECLRRWPNFGSAVMAQARLRRQTPESNHVDFIQARLQQMPVDSQDPMQIMVRAEFESALFKELEDLGRHEEAWSALARSNTAMRAINPYDAAGERSITDALIKASLAASADKSPSTVSFDGPTPIFIVGMPRSGTTLLDRMLSSHSEVVSAGEINDFLRHFHWAADVPPGGMEGMLNALLRVDSMDFAELGARYLAQTQWRAQGQRFYIDKLPTNILMVPFIRRALPHAPILHMVRDPMDVCFSNYKAMFGNISAYSYDMPSVVHYYKQYERLAEHWHSTLPEAMLDVSYASLVRDPETTMRGVLEHCGLVLEQGCLRPEHNAAPVATPSSAQVREPIHTRSIGEWQQYAEHLEPMRLALA